MDRNNNAGEVHLLWVGIVIEGALVVVALALAFWGLYDHRQPLQQLSSQRWFTVLTGGVLATLPLLIFLLMFHLLRGSWLKRMSEFCRTELQPVFRGSSYAELLMLSLMAGIGEEMLFRWCLQGGIASLLESSAGIEVSLMIGLLVASILFGLCHWVNTSYGVITIVVGAYFGLLMIFTQTWLVPALTHAIYDFIALIYIVRMESTENSA